MQNQAKFYYALMLTAALIPLRFRTAGCVLVVYNIIQRFRGGIKVRQAKLKRLALGQMS